MKSTSSNLSSSHENFTKISIYILSFISYQFDSEQAVLLVADDTNIFELTGNGDVLEPEKGVMGKIVISLFHPFFLCLSVTLIAPSFFPPNYIRLYDCLFFYSFPSSFIYSLFFLSSYLCSCVWSFLSFFLSSLFPFVFLSPFIPLSFFTHFFSKAFYSALMLSWKSDNVASLLFSHLSLFSLISLLGVGSGGSYAQGKVHARIYNLDILHAAIDTSSYSILIASHSNTR